MTNAYARKSSSAERGADPDRAAANNLQPRPAAPVTFPDPGTRFPMAAPLRQPLNWLGPKYRSGEELGKRGLHPDYEPNETGERSSENFHTIDQDAERGGKNGLISTA